MRLRWLALLLVIGCSASLTDARAATVVAGQYSITSWSDEDGLPLSQIWALAQTRDGFLWLATTAGLVRFDGQTFKLGLPGVPAGEVTTVFAGRDGGLWIAHNAGEVSRLAPDGTVVTYGVRDGLNAGRVTELLEDSRGTLWVGAPAGLRRFQDNRWEEIGSVGAVTTLYEDRDGNLLVGSRTGVFLLEPGSTRLSRIADGVVNSLSEDSAGGLWANDRDFGLRLLRGAEQALARPEALRGEQGYRLVHDSDGSVWIGTSYEGLLRVEAAEPGRPAAVQRFTTSEGLAHNLTRALLRDRDGNIWIGTLAGLSRVSRSVFASIAGSVLGGSVNSMSVARDGSVWLATTGGLVRYFNGRQTVFRAEHGLPSSHVTVAEEDAAGVLWVGTARGLARSVGNRFEPVRLPNAWDPGYVRTLAAGADGSVWFWTDDGKLTRVMDGRFIEVDTPTSNRGYLTLTDSGGGSWFALTNNAGLVRITEEGIRHYTAKDGLGSGRVNAIAEGRGAIWAATNVGLSRYDGHRFVTLEHSRLPGTPMSVAVDDAGYIWLGMGSGFARLAIAEFEKALGDPSHRIQFSLYDAGDGAPGPPLYVIGRGSVRARDGSVWFATRNGVAIVHPGQLPLRRLPPTVRIETIAADQHEPARTPGARLPRSSRVQFDYVGLSLSSSWVRFRYMLEGFDSQWIDAGTSRQAVYTNLRPGAYRFRVAAANKDGVWSEPAIWAFSVAPAFYESRWFYAVAALALGVLLWAAWQLRLRAVHHRMALVYSERTRVAREIHDTLLQSLVGVAWQLDTIREEHGSVDRMRRQLSMLRTQMEGFIREARESIWSLRSPALAERDLPAALRSAGERITAGSNLEFVLHVSGTPRRLSSRVEQQLLRIGQEAVTNAVRHAQASKVRIELCYTDDAVLLRVSDDGRGFDPATMVRDENEHWGLKSMEERMLEIGGRLSLVSRVGEGTTLEAKAPCSTAA